MKEGARAVGTAAESSEDGAESSGERQQNDADEEDEVDSSLEQEDEEEQDEEQELGIVGIESAQFNAAFLLSTGQMVSETCPELNTELYKSSISDPRLNNRIQYFPVNVASTGGQLRTADGVTPPTTG